MRLTVKAAPLASALANLSGVAQRGAGMPILTHVLVHAHEDGTLRLFATNLEIGLSISIEASGVEIPGRVTVSARKLHDIVRTFDGDSELSFSHDAEKARTEVRSGRSRFVLASLDVEQFPSVEIEEGADKLSVSASVLDAFVSQVQHAMAKNDVRYFLNGMLFDMDGEHFRAVATDGHRLAFYSEAVDDVSVSKPRQAIIPRDAIATLHRLLGTDDANVNVLVSDNQIRFLSGNWELSSRLVDGKFPDYERVLPTDINRKFITDSRLFRTAVHRVSLIPETMQQVRLEAKDGELSISARDQENEAVEFVEIQLEGEPFTLGFQSSYLENIFSALPEGDLRCSLSASTNSLLVEALGDERGRHLVMPVRL